MKTNHLEKFKSALISKEEAKTIFGGYNLNPNGGCSYPICYDTLFAIAKPACETRTNVAYYIGHPYNAPATECLKFV